MLARLLAMTPFILFGVRAAAAASSFGADSIAVFQALNATRASEHVPPVALDTRLSDIAQRYAVEMALNNFFGHVSPEGLGPFARMSRAGYRYRYAGEDLAIDGSALTAAQLLENDPAHRRVMANANFRRVGIGTAHSGQGIIIVEDFSD